jgi:hypothetical protein
MATHTLKESAAINCRLVDLHIDNYLNDMISQQWFKNQPEKTIENIMSLIYDIYADQCRAKNVIRFTSLNTKDWASHDEIIIKHIVTQTAFRDKVAPLVINRHNQFKDLMNKRWKPHKFEFLLQTTPKQLKKS